MNTLSLMIRAATSKDRGVAEQISQDTGLALLPPGATAAQYLEIRDDILSIHLHDLKPTLSFYVDFFDHDHQQMLRTMGRKSPLARAVGLDKKRQLKLCDATAGFGKDSFILNSLGCHIISLERSPIVTALLKNGLSRLIKSSHALFAPWSIKCTDAVPFLENTLASQRPETIYLDPMFPQNNKTAKVKKPMQILQYLHAQEHDNPNLLELACDVATFRVTVKRPKGAEPLNQKKPNFQIQAGHIRFDIYQCNKPRNN